MLWFILFDRFEIPAEAALTGKRKVERGKFKFRATKP